MTLYNPIRFGKTIAYMLQNTEYNVPAYIKWLNRIRKFDSVMYRRKLVGTKFASMFRLFATLGELTQILAGLGMAAFYLVKHKFVFMVLGLGIAGSAPLFWAYLVVLPLIIGRLLVSSPKERKLIARSKQIFAKSSATKIAVAGSYGKTTVKELLGTILSEAKKVAITPANKNVAYSQAIFASILDGSEDVLVVEFGEGKKGDVVQFTDTLQPDIGFVTGIAPAHLDQYSSLDQAAQDIFYLAQYLSDKKSLYVNADSPAAAEYVSSNFTTYNSTGCGDLKVKNLKLEITGMSFKLVNHTTSYNLKTALVGEHLLGPISACVAVASSLGLTKAQIEAGVAKTAPFEHRLQPRQLASGAWIIDDTYNGNIDGIAAGTRLLKQLTAKRKIYVTPGLVDQGDLTKEVHVKLGGFIAKSGADVTVLMQNSVTDFIIEGLKSSGYSGELKIESDPLNFYSNIEAFVAAGDIILMQNDWPDNYN